MVVPLCRGLLIVVTPEPLITGNLIRVEQRPRFEMRREMHGPQATLQLGNGGRRRCELIRRDVAFGEELVEGLLLCDQLVAERFSGESTCFGPG